MVVEMSRIGKKPITIPSNVSFSIEGTVVKVHGPRGSLELDTRSHVRIEHNGNEVYVYPLNENTKFQGLYRTLINNLVEGVTNGYVKKLELIGIGYKASLQGSDLVLNVGYSHPVIVKKVEGIEFSVSENIISVSGVSKVLVGDVAARIRSIRPPEPYKGKGIRYLGENVIRKETKG